MIGKCKCSVFTKKLSFKKHTGTTDADVKISKPGELLHLALSITIFVRVVDVRQSPFRIRSINLVFGHILLPFQQVQLGSQLVPAPLPAALVVHLEVFQLKGKCSRQVGKSPSTLLMALSTKSSRIAPFKLAMCLMSK